MAGDAASADDVSGAVRLAVARFGRLDLLWANAGTGVAKTVPEMTLDEWDRVLAVNLTGAFLLAKFGIPELAAAGGGTMVITGSANSFTADRSWAAYCASKGGLLMLCRALALDHAATASGSTSSARARSPPRCTRPGWRPGPAAGRWPRSGTTTGPPIRWAGSPTRPKWPRRPCSCPARSPASPLARRCWWTGA